MNNQVAISAQPYKIGATAKPFDWEGTVLRSFKDPQGIAWFVAKDVCDALEFRDAHNATRGLDNDEKGTRIVSTPGGEQAMQVINESGLYSLILKSRKPEAKSFKRWLTHVVLPAIRLDGAYIKGEERLLTATTADELAECIASIEATATQATQAKVTRGVCAIEEREARTAGFKVVNRGRVHRKRRPSF